MSTYRYNGTPRKGRKQPSDAGVVLFCFCMVALLLAALWYGLLRGEPAETKAVTHDSLAPTYTHDGEIIRWYVLTDPDTSVQYLVNDRGGCTPRLDQYGNVIGVQTWQEN